MVMQLRNARQSVNTKTLAELEAEILEIQRKAGSGQHLDEHTWRRKDRMCARVKELKKQVAAERHQQVVVGIIDPTGTAPQALEFHPLADIFPLMEGAEFEELVADIKKLHGLRDPLTMFERKILDGRNRYRACREAGVEVKTELFEGDKESALAFVISKNICRRHLKSEKKRKIIEGLIKANPEKSDRQIGKIAKADNKTVATIRAGLERREEIPHVSERTDSRGRQQPAKKRRRPTVEDFKRDTAAKKAAIIPTVPVMTVRDPVAPDEELALLREFARLFISERARINCDPKDRDECRMVFNRVKAMLVGAL
jgi:hypothetical protein